MDRFLRLNSPHEISILTELKGRKGSWARWQAAAGAGVEGKKRTLSAEGWGSVTEGFVEAGAFEEGLQG